MTARHTCPAHGPTLFRSCPSCQAERRGGRPKTAAEARHAILASASRARAARIQMLRHRQESDRNWGCA